MLRIVVPADVAAFRAKYRQQLGPRYSGWRHFATTSFVALAAIGFAVARVHGVRALELAAVPAFVAIANLGEYLGHRGPMHHRRARLGLVFARHTLQHHAFYTHEAMEAETPTDFQMVLFPPVLLVFFLGGMAAPIGLVLAWLGGANLGWLFVATAVAYFLAYEWLHFAYHQPATSWLGRRALVQRLRRHHAIHHDPARMTRVNFNITLPLADTLFGTRADR